MIAGRAALVVALAVAGCADSRADASPSRREPALSELTATPFGELCRTRGKRSPRRPLRSADPTVRAVAAGSDGDRAALRFTYRGASDGQARLASGEAREQLGLKLRAADSCNVVYVMWRVSGTPRIEVSIKRTPGEHRHEECGVGGYTSIAPRRRKRLPVLRPGDAHTLHARIAGDDLTAWVDGRVVWQGRLDASARKLAGPAGVRTDNVKLDLELYTRDGDRESTGPAPRCLD